MDRTQKVDTIDEIRGRFDRMINAVITDYRGLDVEAMTELRNQFRKASIDYKVVKNTLVMRAVEDQPYAADLSPHLKEMTAIAWSYEDPSASAKVIRDFAKTNDKIKIKCGIMDGQVHNAQGWADLPSLPDLLSMIMAQLVSPPQSLMRQMVGPAEELVSLMDAWKEKLEGKEQGATE
jgi:large subunit ribosomal protein L10